MEYFDYINELRDKFNQDNDDYPRYLIQSVANKAKLLLQMSRAGIPPRANPSSSYFIFMGAEILEGPEQLEGFYSANPLL